MSTRQGLENPRGKRPRRWARWLLGLGLAAGGAATVVQAQAPRAQMPQFPQGPIPHGIPHGQIPQGVIPHAQAQETLVASRSLPAKTHMNKNPFYLPVTLDERERNLLQEIHLYVKEDPTHPWVLAEKITPRQNCFTFKAPRDGEYWFTLVTIDKSGRSSPPDDTPSVIALLDTEMPQVEVLAVPGGAEGQVARVDVRDVNIDASKTQFLYQTQNGSWHTGEALPNSVNHFCVPRQAAWTGMVKVMAADHAGNSVVREINLQAQTAMTSGAPTHPALTPTHPGMNGNNVTAPPIGAAHPTVRTTQIGEHETVVVLDGNAKQGGEPYSIKHVDRIVPQPSTPQPITPKHVPANSFSREPGSISGNVNRTAPAPHVVEKVEMVGHGKVAETTPLPLQPVEPRGPLANHQRQAAASPAALQPAPIHTIPETPVKHVPDPGVKPLQAVSLNKQIVNHTHLFLDYQIEQTGPSGVGRVEIWLTKDQGQSWQKHGEARERKSPAEIDLPGEGLFGVSLVVSNGRGFGATPPGSGDAPDWWVEVDVTKPVAEITGIRPSSPEDASALIISWTARDKNMGATPIDLHYAMDRNGPWHPIAKGLRNEGFYRWHVPGDLGPHAFIRLVATDQAGNVTQCESAHPVALDDLSRPRARVSGISTVAPKISVVPQR